MYLEKQIQFLFFWGNKMSKYSVKLSKLISKFNLESIYLPKNPKDILIYSSEVNRPGLHISGFYKYFQPSRIQIIGNMETAYLKDMPSNLRMERLEILCKKNIPAIIITNNNVVFDEMVKSAKFYGIPLLRAKDSTTNIMSSLITFLNVELAPRLGMHGVFVEVYGEGVLITGESGVGKSETAMELIKRGHRLVADDEVEIRRVSTHALIGSSPKNIRHFMELRGIGIVNARRLFGVGAIKNREKVNMIVDLETWTSNQNYDRTGLQRNFTNILGVKIPKYKIPIKPGRNLAIIIEVAAINNRQNKMGYNAAEDLFTRLGFDIE